jgi:hypothetical protein
MYTEREKKKCQPEHSKNADNFYTIQDATVPAVRYKYSRAGEIRILMMTLVRCPNNYYTHVLTRGVNNNNNNNSMRLGSWGSFATYEGGRGNILMLHVVQ